jgi:hypothetical protein
MSRKHLPFLALVAAAVLAPAVLHAQAGKDSSSTAAPQPAGSQAIETGRIDTTAKDTSQAAAKSDTASTSKPDSKAKKAKHPKETADTAPRSYSPY